MISPLDLWSFLQQQQQQQCHRPGHPPPPPFHYYSYSLFTGWLRSFVLQEEISSDFARRGKRQTPDQFINDFFSWVSDGWREETVVAIRSRRRSGWSMKFLAISLQSGIGLAAAELNSSTSSGESAEFSFSLGIHLELDRWKTEGEKIYAKSRSDSR